MNYKIGFKRILFCLSVVAGITFATFSVSMVLGLHNRKLYTLNSSLLTYEKEYDVKGLVVRDLFKNTPVTLQPSDIKRNRKTLESINTGLNKQIQEPPVRLTVLQQSERTEDMLSLMDSLWVNLSKGEVLGMCVLSSLICAIVGFASVWGFVWFLYSVVYWIKLGFCEDSTKRDQL